jgi:hypothetical protein
MEPFFQRFSAFALIILLPSVLLAQALVTDDKLDELLEWDRLSGKAKSTQWKNSLENTILTNSSNCKLIETKVFHSARYYTLDCKSKRMSHLINFQNQKFDKSKSWKLTKTHTFGNKQYIEIQFLSNQYPVYKPNNEGFEIPNNSNSTKNSNSSIKENPNLKYFIETALYNKDKIQSAPNLPIFFDHSCPLEYLGENHDFYWDDRIYHDFYITCINKSLVSLVRLEGTKLGEIQIGNVLRKEIKKGEKFLASIVLKEWQDDRILWGEFKIYPYENK